MIKAFSKYLNQRKSSYRQNSFIKYPKNAFFKVSLVSVSSDHFDTQTSKPFQVCLIKLFLNKVVKIKQLWQDLFQLAKLCCWWFLLWSPSFKQTPRFSASWLEDYFGFSGVFVIVTLHHHHHPPLLPHRAGLIAICGEWWIWTPDTKHELLASLNWHIKNLLEFLQG